MKKNIVTALRWILLVLNIAIGYFIPIISYSIFLFFINRPKGLSYFVPDSDHLLNVFIGAIVFFIWAIVELIINVPIITISKNEKGKSLILILLFKGIGIATYFILKIFYF